MNAVGERSNRAGLGSPTEAELSALVGMAGRLVTVTFRGARVYVLAGHDRAAQRARDLAPRPITDLLHLELLSGVAEDPSGWVRPVALHAVIEARRDPLLAVQRASRWASYAARIAVVAEERLTEKALLEAELLGVWMVAAGAARRFQVVAAGQRGPVVGSGRGLFHRLLDELIWAELDRSDAVPQAVTPAATR
jgi:hypothetical protein